MNPRFLRSGWFPIGLLSLALLVPASPGLAQKKKPAPVAPSGLPTIAQPAPMGCQRGVPLEFTVTGANLGGPTQLFLGFPAKVDILTDEKKPSDTAVKIRIETAKDAPLGIHPLRLATGGGLSNLRLFCVDDLPQILDNDANRDKAKPQSVQVPCVIAGKTDAEQSDWYKITTTAGQRLSFEILGRRLGSPIDPLISIYSVKTQREVAHNNDSPGCQGDPRLSHVFKEAGDYLIEVRDVLGRGGPDYIYRLRIGDFPMANVPIPMAAKAGSKVQVGFAGPMVDGVKPVDVAVPNEPVGNVVWVTPKSASGLSGWPVPLFISDVEELEEKEPNDDAAKATRLPVPCGVTGRFLPGDMIDVYAIAAKKGRKLVIEAQTLEWGSPSLLYITVKNAKGAEVAKSNPQSPPPGDQRVEVTATEDGDLLIEVQHLLFQSGPAEAYHLSIRPATPTFDIVLSQDKAEASTGNSAAIPFQVIRKGYTGPIDLTTRLRKSPITVNVKAGQTSGLLFVPIDSGRVESFQVEAKATVDGKPVIVLASAKPSVSKALADLVYPSQHLLSRVEVGGRDKVPFSIVAKLEPAEASPGTTPSVVITLKREEGFVEEVTLNALIGLPANVPAPKLGPIAKGKSELKIPLDVNGKTANGDYFVLLSAKAKSAGREIVSDVAVLSLSVGAPFDLTIEPGKIELVPGMSAKVTLKATRKAGYKGPIAIDFKNLPAKVTAAKASIGADQTSVVVELSAAKDAALVERVEIEAVGTASALNNLQGTSTPAVLRVKKEGAGATKKRADE